MRDDVHISRPKFFRDKDLNQEAILSYVFSSETEMPVARFMGLQKDYDGLKVSVCWKGLPDVESLK